MPEETVLGEKALTPDVPAPKPEAPFGTAPIPEVPSHPEAAPEKREGKYAELLSKVTPKGKATTVQDDDKDAITLDAKHIGDTLDEGSKIQKLLDLASAKGPVYAVKVARSLKDYYALDKMHDDLADKLYAGLLEKGLIEKE